MKKVVLLLSLFSLTASATIPEAVKFEIDQRVEHQLNPSIVVAVYEKGQSDFYAQGLQHRALNLKATSQSVYEIGSVSKTFTSLLLAHLVTQGKIQLDDPVQNFWPQSFSLKDSENQAITFKQLATHTSGLPRLPANLSVNSQDPYADYDRKMLLSAVSQVKAKPSGINYAYSNFAVGLLGETLASVENATYNELITTIILQPLHLNQTYMLLDDVPEALLAQGYNGNSAVQAWQFKALAGAGSIRSSIEDLLAYGIAHLSHSEHDLKTAMQLATTNHYQQDNLTVGLGWHINTDGLIWHNGGTAGFSSIILIDAVQQKVVAGLTNNSINNIEDIAMHLMDQSKPMVDHQFPVAIETDQLELYTGTFNHSASDKIITIIKQQDQLFFTAYRQPRQLMTFIGDDTFKLKTFNVKLKFKRDANDQIIDLDLDGWGDPQTYEKSTKQ